MSKHTEGPWTLVARPCSIGCCYVWEINAKYPDDAGPDRNVATANGGNAVWLKEGEVEANARLLAAAPDLLEACHAMLTGSMFARQKAEAAIDKALNGHLPEWEGV